MKNPFRFGQLVTGVHFCNRLTELKEMKKAIINGYFRKVIESVIVYLLLPR
jgi:hypothetical protein